MLKSEGMRTVRLTVTGAAAAYVALPGCVAVIEHVPAVTRVNVEPATVHTACVFDANATARPGLAVATNAIGATPS